jgi:hypothetical protein
MGGRRKNVLWGARLVVCGCLAGVLMSGGENETHKKASERRKSIKKYDITQFQRVKRLSKWFALGN